MRRAAGWLLAVTGFLACPCHLIITLPLLVGLLGGTAAGAFLAANMGLVVVLALIYFVVATRGRLVPAHARAISAC